MAGAILVPVAMVGLALPTSAAPGGSPSVRSGHPSVASSTGSTSITAAVKAVVVKSWGQCTSGNLVWDALNANWASYGSKKIVIDYSDPTVCGTSFTLDALEATGADVVILDDPSGQNQTFSAAEVDAIETYANEGHDLVGTYLTFAYPFGGVDNSALAPIFGLQQNAGWAGGEGAIDPAYKLMKKKFPSLKKTLFHNLPNPYTSTGFNSSQMPGDGKWSGNDLAGAKIVGHNAARTTAITLYQQGTYNAVFIANMPEYGGGTQDQQFLYNAIIFPRSG